MKNSGVILAILVFFSAIGFSSASEAHGFLDLVFGFGRQAQPSQTYFAPARPHSWQHRAIGHHKYKNRHELARNHRHSLAWHHRNQQSVTPPEQGASRPCCSNAQEAINHIVKDDPTLRPGDAYMSTEGLRVYQGERDHDPQFVPVDEARHIGAGLKQRLAEVESKVRISTAEHTREVDANTKKRLLAETQHGANDKKHKEKLVHGPDGRLIRMVGGFVN